MASGYRNGAGVDTDDLYDPDVVGDGPVATGFLRADGTTLRYASAMYGTPGDAIGFRDQAGADNGPKWAKKGTANYWSVINHDAAGFDKETTSGVAVLGTAEFRLMFNPDGYLRQQVLGGGGWWTVNTSKFVTGSNSAGSYQVRISSGIAVNRYTGSGAVAGYITTNNGAGSFQPVNADRILDIYNGSGYVYNGNYPVLHGDVIFVVTVDLMDPAGRVTTKQFQVRMDVYGSPQPND
ncbi:hypothetical protein RKE25_02600 [Dyella sp. BiH032]|uniref:hypothetical protein n=1 Tax=Dyella sp. BiH032 TaxID=3075430 RepID=UPI002892C698|nr:hypothetical protein [Dyella sp. BiH032]WNL46546.1 hypothetical protein RKE25_02600 [Dyella sp. BiH032]